ncbi:hypothetical protein PHLGIDRAFT_447081 [Phlebiopsis gigantea 11061_1 CR5-6]|uniref:NTF2 domain-containing protein n=1 Tax=Phlebiopsis gigantea (strain 11061_1 CR5-6) TaxID=745531 RepID=A0A0C3SA54_PHLG1|nr:hypothetical protein PHLGIDRAFT_447081 [Phlebiopsis gigantea 11061_1 CR5-6]
MSSTLPFFIPLSSWTEGRLRALLSAKTKADFDTAFDDFLAPHAHVTLNGETVSRAHYAAQLWNDVHTNARSVSVSFNGVVEVPKSAAGAAIPTGDVGVFYAATIQRENTHVRPPILATDLLRASLQLVVDFPAGQPKDHDNRRVISLAQLSAEQVVRPRD